MPRPIHESHERLTLKAATTDVAFARQWALDLAEHERAAAPLLLGGLAVWLTLLIAADVIATPALAVPFAVGRVALAAAAIGLTLARRAGALGGVMPVRALLLAMYVFFAWGATRIDDPSALAIWNMNIAVGGVFWPAVVWRGSVRQAAECSAAFAALMIAAQGFAGRVPLPVVLVSGGLFLVFAWGAGPLLTQWRVRTMEGESRLRHDLRQKTAEAEAQRVALAAQAEHDAMTGLLNRRAGLEFLGSARDRSRRYGKPVTVAYVDLDGLKRVNDEHGHAVGDAMICAAAAILREGVRGSDIVCRMGGDEFMAVLEDCTAEAAAVAVARWLSAVDAYNAAAGGRFRLGLSVGLAEWGADSSLRAEEVVSQADAEMFVQKRAAHRARESA